ncbi:KRAB-A domain-containing protein 2-like [Littorina saxatilis]|uniref:KRAB-A domain-containing protein 2-like n=1 Tax=Littorina saxatilis TaxID=31220 RepID=UPI0038B6253C
MSIEERFTQKLMDHFKENKKGLIPKCDYQKTIDALKAAADNSHANGRLGICWRSMKYSSAGLQKKLIQRRSTRHESPLYYVSIEGTFDVVKSAHISTGHGGRDRMLKELQKKYANIPTKAVELFKSLCQECQKKRKRPMTKGVVVRPILTKEFSSRGQVDLIDMQSMPSGSNKKWIMVYQDHLTKFCILRALTS